MIATSYAFDLKIAAVVDGIVTQALRLLRSGPGGFGRDVRRIPPAPAIDITSKFERVNLVASNLSGRAAKKIGWGKRQ